MNLLSLTFGNSALKSAMADMIADGTIILSEDNVILED